MEAACHSSKNLILFICLLDVFQLDTCTIRLYNINMRQFIMPFRTTPLVLVLMFSLFILSSLLTSYALGTNSQPDTSAENVYKNHTMILGNNIKNLVILIPNEAHEPPGLPKELRVVNQPYLPQNVVANVGTTIIWFPTDIPHNHQVSIVDKNSSIVFDSGVIKFNTASKPLKLNESDSKFVFYEKTKNPKYPDFVLNGTITVIDQKSASNTNSTSANGTSPDTIVTYMVPAKELDKRISEFKSKGFGVDSTYSFKSLRGGGSEAGGDTQEYLLVLTSTGKDIDSVISALKDVTATMPYT
jgi:hypothetical protein